LSFLALSVLEQSSSALKPAMNRLSEIEGVSYFRGK